jgi:hypothetical protein
MRFRNACLPVIAACVAAVSLSSALGAGGDQGFKPLFNGKNLNGWKTFFKDDKADATKTIVVKNGEIQGA